MARPARPNCPRSGTTVKMLLRSSRPQPSYDSAMSCVVGRIVAVSVGIELAQLNHLGFVRLVAVDDFDRRDLDDAIGRRG